MPSRRSFLRAGATLVTLPAAAACNAILGPSKFDDNWDVQERGRFTFYVRPQSFAASNVDRFDALLEAQYDDACAMLDIRYGGHVSVFLYPTAADAGLESDHSGVAYPDTQAVRAVCVPPFDDSLMALVSHEFNHVITRNALGQAGTTFMNEGIASAVIVERFHSAGRHFLFPWTRSRGPQLPALTALVDDAHWRDVPQDVAYNTSASFLAWLIDARGPERLKHVFNVRSHDFVGETQRVYGEPLTQLEAEWRVFCDKWIA